MTKPLNESIVFNIISNSFLSDQRIPIAKRRIHDVFCMAVPSHDFQSSYSVCHHVTCLSVVIYVRR